MEKLEALESALQDAYMAGSVYDVDQLCRLIADETNAQSMARTQAMLDANRAWEKSR
jgi:hypothetical protein